VAFALKLSRGFQARQCRDDVRGGAALEFAIIGPVLLMMLLGIFTYGGYFLTAHTVQQMANDAARAAIAGLDDTERLALARQSLQASIEAQPFMRGELSNVELARQDNVVHLRITYDASEDLYWAFESLVPPPSPHIARTVSVRVGGY